MVTFSPDNSSNLGDRLVLHAVMTCKVFAWGGFARHHSRIQDNNHDFTWMNHMSTVFKLIGSRLYTEPKHLRTTAECDSAGQRQWHIVRSKNNSRLNISWISLEFFRKKILHFSNTMFQRAAKMAQKQNFALDSYGACASCPSFFASISILASNSAVVMWSWWS